MAFSPDGRTLATGGADPLVHLWDVRTGKLVRELEQNVGTAWALEFSPDGSVLAISGGDPYASLWDVATGEQLGSRLGGVGSREATIDLSPDGLRLLMTHGDGKGAVGRRPGVVGAARLPGPLPAARRPSGPHAQRAHCAAFVRPPRRPAAAGAAQLNASEAALVAEIDRGTAPRVPDTWDAAVPAPARLGSVVVSGRASAAYTRVMKEIARGRIGQVAGKYADNALLAAACCNACRTCMTTNAVGVLFAAAATVGLVAARLARRLRPGAVKAATRPGTSSRA